MADIREQFQLDIAGTIATSSRDRWVAPFNGDITGVIATVATAPTGATMILDVQKNGVTMFSTVTKATIPIAGTKSPKTAAPDVTAFVTGDEITLVPTQVGSSVAGADLNVSVEYVVR